MSTKLSKAQQQAIVFLTTKQREAETLRDTVMQDAPDFNFDRARSIYAGAFHKATVAKLVKLGLVEYTFTKQMIALVMPQGNDQPDPEPPAPAPAKPTLPTAQIGEVAAPKKLDVADTSFDIDGTDYNIEFFEEYEGFMAYVVMYVNGKLFKVQTLQKRANTGYRYFSRSTFKNGVEVEEMVYNTRPHISIFLDKQASLMLYVFKNTLKYQATQASKTATPVTPATVAQVEVLPSPEQRFAFKVGDKVLFDGKLGNDGKPHKIVHRIDKGSGGKTWYGVQKKVEKGYNVIFCTEEKLTLYQDKKVKKVA